MHRTEGTAVATFTDLFFYPLWAIRISSLIIKQVKALCKAFKRTGARPMCVSVSRIRRLVIHPSILQIQMKINSVPKSQEYKDENDISSNKDIKLVNPKGNQL